MERTELAQLRKAKGWTQAELAELVGVTDLTVSRYERGVSTPQGKVKRDMADTFGIPLARLEALLGNGSSDHQLAPQWFSLFVSSEQTATSVESWAHAVIPGLLQTRDYARALIKREHTSGVENLVDLRMSRHDALDREPPLELGAILAEGSLRVKVGDSAVMADQLAHLLELSERRNLSLRVLPFDAGPHTAELSFHILTLPWGAEIAYYESYEGAHYAESDISPFRSLYQHLAGMSLSFTETRELIRGIRHDHVA